MPCDHRPKSAGALERCWCLLNHFSAAAHTSGELLDFLGEMLVSKDGDPLERELNENMINKQSAARLYSGGMGFLCQAAAMVVMRVWPR